MWSITATLVRGVREAAMLATMSSGSGRGKGSAASTMRAPVRSQM